MKKRYFFHELPLNELKGKTILLDIDGTLVCDGESEPSEQVRHKVAELKKIAKVYLVSNKPNAARNEAISHALGVPLIKSRYRKPDRRACGDVEFDPNHTVVIGDKFLTDGLFAHFLKAKFIKVRRYHHFWKKFFLFIGGGLVYAMFHGVVFHWAYGTQNTYFLQALAQSNYGFLSHDWLANQTDAFPLFTLLVRFAYALGGQYIFPVLEIFAYALFVYSLTSIARTLFPALEKIEQRGVFYVLFLLMHAVVVGIVTFSLIHTDITWHLANGVAEQGSLDTYFQQSASVVFLFWSLSFALKDEWYQAVIVAVIAPLFHPTYLLGAGAFVGCYVLFLLYSKFWGRARNIAVIGLLGVMPVLVYTWIHFQSTSQLIHDESTQILIDRIPHHALPSHWFDTSAVGQIMVVVLALYLIRKTRAFFFIGLTFLIATIGTIITAILLPTPLGRTLATLFFPWRVSVVLVPLSATILVGYIASRIHIGKITRSLKWLLLVIMICLAVINSILFFRQQAQDSEPKAFAMMEFVKHNANRNDLYAIPPREIESFRIRTGVPIVVDYKSFPYKDRELIEWRRRLGDVDALYENGGPQYCYQFEQFQNEYHVSHIVFIKDHPQFNCGGFHEVYSDEYYRVYSRNL